MKTTDKILIFVKKSIRNRGYPPTLREIGKRFGFCHTTAMCHLNKLIKEKRLKFRIATKKRASRSMKIQK